MMRTLRLYGPMGARFGRQHRFDLDSGTTSEAFAALMSQVKGVREYLADAEARGIAFAIFVGKRNLTAEHLTLPANGEIRVAPVPMGRKNQGGLTAIVGIIIIAIAWINPFGYLTGPMVSAMYTVGIAMVAGGIVQMLTPVPHGVTAKDAPNNVPNASFNGPINTQAQGNPVPVGYGRMKIGSAVLSAGIDTLDTSYYAPGSGPGFMGGGGGCPELDMPVLVLIDGREVEVPAAEIRVGDVLVTADPVTLAPGTAVVRYSEAKLQPCVGVLIAERSIHCSTTAPLPTRLGLQAAPDVAGQHVADKYSASGWAPVLAVYGRGLRWVQHVDIDNGCFWVNGILHHNKLAALRPGD